ncbi:MAG: hypothetical protein KDB48_10740 [Solirubrobacterales bacterium]|nr:hypothetical protein [Solirubrobacterales bacterium]HMT04629.1 hypothetical protein [Solirubrobacterales bacterium]
MTVTVGPYEFKRARFYPWKDWLDLDNDDGDLAICECSTDDGDRWFSRMDEPDRVAGIEIEFVSTRIEDGLMVELPTGERVPVDGADDVIKAGLER